MGSISLGNNENASSLPNKNPLLASGQSSPRRYSIDERNAQDSGSDTQNHVGCNGFDPMHSASMEKTDAPLFPQISKKDPIPEGASDVCFDRSFLHRRFEDQNLSEFERKLRSSDSGLFIALMSQVLDMRVEEQKENLESFKLLHEKMRYLREEKSKILDDLAENSEIEAAWLSKEFMISYLTKGIGIAAGIAVLSLGVYRGNKELVLPGIGSIIGGLGSLLSEQMSQNGDYPKIATATSFASAAVVGVSNLSAASAALNMKAMKVLELFGGAFSATLQGAAKYQISQTNKRQYAILREVAKIKHHHEKNKTKETKALGSLKLIELLNEGEAASKQQTEEDQLKERIAQILSSAA